MRENDDLRGLLAVARRWRLLAIVVFSVVLGIALIAAFMLPPKYTSTMKILVRSSPTDLVATAQRADTVILGQVGETEVNSEVALLTNYDLLRSAVVYNHLAHRGWFSAGSERENIDTAVLRLGKGLDVVPLRKANIIEVQYADKSPQRAADVLRTIEAGYLEAHLRAQSTPGGYNFFQTQVGYYGHQLEQAQNELAAFSRRENAANLDQRRTLLTQIIADRQTSLEQAVAAAAQLRNEISRAETLQSGLAPRLVTSTKSGANQYAVDHLTALLAGLRNRRTQQISKFRDDDEFIKETDAEIVQTAQALDLARTKDMLEQTTDVNPVSQSLGTSLANRGVELAGWTGRRNALQAQIRNDTAQLNHLSDVVGQYNRLVDRVQQARDSTMEYTHRQEQARVAEGLDRDKITNVVIAQEPTESAVPAQSRLPLNLLLGLAAAIFASVTAILTGEYIVPVFREKLA